jgi:predicted ferric reductase
MTTTASDRWQPAHGRWHQRRRLRRADLMESLAIGSLVVLGVLFVARGGGHVLVTGSSGDRLVAVGQLTGLVAADLLLLQLLLAARLPWVDRSYGLDRALLAHRVLGRVTIPLVLVHAGALVLGYAERDHLAAASGWLVEPWLLLTGGVPDMVTATISLALLVTVAVTSVRVARARMGYERWHLVHLTAYAAVLLSLPHQLLVGTDIAGHRLTRAYWLGLYLLTAGSLVWWRLVLPLARSIWHAPYVEQVVAEGPGVWSVWIRGRRLDRLGAQSGQFFNWRFLARGLVLAAHPWSLSAAPGPRRMRITVRDLGDHSARLAQLKPGTRVLIEGPYGAFTAERRLRPRVLLLAAGIGITPVRALAEELCADPGTRPGAVTLVYRVDSPDEIVLQAELRELAASSGLTLHMLTGPPAAGSWLPPGWAADAGGDGPALCRLVPGVRAQDVYVCGPPRWMDLVHASLADAGVPGRQVHDERFSW